MLSTLKAHLPRDWDKYNRKRYVETTLSYGSEHLRRRFMDKFVNNINRVTTVECPALYGSFLLRKAEYQSRGVFVNIKELYHDTAASKIPSILDSNLDWRMVSRDKFGHGVSFSPSSSYANKESSRRNGTERAMIIADVLVGRSHEGNHGIPVPHASFDTTTGNRSNVYVKFYDNEFYPKYVIYYNSK